MGDKERAATIGTWERILEEEEGVKIFRYQISTRLKNLGIIGEKGISRNGRYSPEGFFRESDVREACKELLQISMPLDTTYFQNPQNLKADLTAFANELGTEKAPLDLSTSKIKSLSITCQNGQTMKGETYLRTAAKALDFAKDSKEADPKQAHTLRHLLKLAGFEPFDEAYFQNPQNLKADLTAFANELGPEKAPLDLSTSKIKSLSITCQNGQTMKGLSYLSHAAIALGFAEDSNEAHSKQAHTLRHLLRLADFEPFDEAYFQNPQNLKADLTAFANELGPEKAPLDLSTSKIKSLSITCQNGQTMKGETYLNHAAKALGLAKNGRAASSKRAHTLKTLKEMAGFLTDDYDR